MFLGFVSFQFFFFFQAEDGIRDADVTGVQTCALPIFGDGSDGGLGGLDESGSGLGRGPGTAPSSAVGSGLGRGPGTAPSPAVGPVPVIGPARRPLPRRSVTAARRGGASASRRARRTVLAEPARPRLVRSWCRRAARPAASVGRAGRATVAAPVPARVRRRG